MSSAPPLPPIPPRPPAIRVLPVLALILVGLIAGLLFLAGDFAFHVARHVHVSQHTTATGDENVAIHLPFGDLKVETEQNGGQFGIDVYPGAVPVAKDAPSAFGLGVEVGGHHYRSAHVHLQFGDHALFVAAGEFASPASAEAVLDFYRARMAGLGPVKEEHHEKNGAPATELRVTVGDNAHVVAVRDWQGGSRFVLVRVNHGGGSI
ncbi:MAG: hypothetical protein ACYC6M_04060 [Terriglobales bacterium]